MNKKILLLIFTATFTLGFVQSPKLEAATRYVVESNRSPFRLHYPPQAENAIKRLRKVSEFNTLVDQALEKGDIRIVINRHEADDFGAMWDGGSRTIHLSHYTMNDLGNAINGIVFELHNAKSDDVLKRYTDLARQGRIDKDTYVEGIERMEHSNGLQASVVLQKGIEKELIPPSSGWTIAKDFEDYYILQQLYGHSQWIANTYDQMNRHKPQSPFKGTVPHLQSLNMRDKREISRFLDIKNRISSNDPNIASTGKVLFEQELEKLRRDSFRSHSSRLHYRSKVFEKIFQVAV